MSWKSPRHGCSKPGHPFDFRFHFDAEHRMNEALTQNPTSDVPERALLVVQILVWPRRFWTDAPQSSFWTQRDRARPGAADGARRGRARRRAWHLDGRVVLPW